MNFINRYYTKLWIATLLFLPVATVTAFTLYTDNGDYRLLIIVTTAILADILLIIKLLHHTINIIYRFIECMSAKEHNTYFIAGNDKLLGPLTEKINETLQQACKERRAIERTFAYNERTTRVISHELRNSLAPIISLSACNDNENIKESMQVIHEQATAVNNFVNAFHRLSNIPAPNIKEVNTALLFKKIARLLYNEKGKCSLQFTSPQELSIKADTNQLTLVLINLLRNSLHALEGQSNGKIEVCASSVEGKKYITVKDNGPGIADEHKEYIFEPFYSTRKKGTGIGLPLSRQIMFLHGGDLKLLSTRAGNTIFMLEF